MKIEKLDHQGRGICFYNNKITFVKNALPDEDVEIKIINSKKKFNEALVKKYNFKSSKRVISACPYYELCGGCSLMHLNYSDELEYKKNKVIEILKRYGNIDINNIDILSPTEYNYRNKATFQVKENVGYYKENTYEIIPIDNCLIVDNRINDILKEIKKINLKNIYQIVIRYSKYTNESMIVFKCKGEIDVNYDNISVNNIVIYDRKYEVKKGIGYITEKLNDLTFIISPDSFFQVNTMGAIALYDKVKEFANLNGNENILDLYCGTGTIGLYLSKFCSSIIGVEINRYAVEDAIKNKKLNHIKNIDFICDDAANVNFKNLDLVIVDPPRSGLDNKTINYLLNLEVEKIIYVSCDPITLARDLKLLKEKYDLMDISLVNMFSKTYHVESVCVIKLR